MVFLLAFWLLVLIPSENCVPWGSVLGPLFSLCTCLRRHHPFQWLWDSSCVLMISPVCISQPDVHSEVWEFPQAFQTQNVCRETQDIPTVSSLVIVPRSAQQLVQKPGSQSKLTPLPGPLSCLHSQQVLLILLYKYISVLLFFPIFTFTMIQATTTSYWENTVVSVVVRIELGYISYKPLNNCSLNKT